MARTAHRPSRTRRLLFAIALVIAAMAAAPWITRLDAPQLGEAARKADRQRPPAGSPGRRPPVQKTVTIAAVGDIAMGRDGALPPSGAAALLGGVRAELRGGVVLGNLEQTLTDGGVSKCGAKSTDCYAFRSPPADAGALRAAGFTVLNLANNHSLDYGGTGLADTVAALDAAGLAHTGEPGQATRVRKQPVRVSVVGFSYAGLNGGVLDPAGAAELVRLADRWADVVVVTMHAGAEGHDRGHVPEGAETHLGENRGDLRVFSHAVVDAGADLVVGHGPHVLRGLEWYRGRLIAYSLGNFAGYRTLRTDGPGGVSAILRVTLRGDGSWSAGRLVPTRLDGTGTASLDSAGQALGAVRDLSQADFGARAVRVGQAGELSLP
jgi:poly-gamma-glutamate capsule biosynthesis protein CapA/YwtB (metallophosphatase superfamily)